MIADFLFFLFLVSAVLGSLLVITRRNPVASVMFLILVFFSLSGMFLLLDAHFIAALQVILYAGAIMVLFLFVVMLLNLGHMPWDDVRGPLGRLVAGSVALALLASVTKFFLTEGGAPTAPARDPVEAALAARGAVGAVAEPLFRDFIVPLQVTGLLLLVAMVGAIVLARRKAP